MEEQLEHGMDLYVQDGVLLKSASASHMSDINTTGILSIVEYPNTSGSRYVEWKPTDIIVDSDIQDQEWAVVNTVGRRSRALSETSSVESQNRARIVRLNLNDTKCFRVTRNSQQMSFTKKDGSISCSFFFQHGNADRLVHALKALVRTVSSRKDRNLYTIIDDQDIQALDRSFAELNIFPENTSDFLWKMVKNFQNHPYETTMEAFSKLTDIVYRGPEETRCVDDEVKELLTRSITQMEETTSTQTQGEFEVIAHVPKPPPLPPRPSLPRGTPLNLEQWATFQDSEGHIQDVSVLKHIIFKGGITPLLRNEVWKYLLNYYPWNSTHVKRKEMHRQKVEEYYTMKLQWRSITLRQENNFSDYRERKSLIEKDVNRTDRTNPYFAGDNNPHLQLLSDILMTYVMYNFDLGYVQGMSDLLSPILYLMENEVDAFWCFAGFMDKVCHNFDMDQAGMKEQLHQLHTLVAFVDPTLSKYLDQHDSGNMFFCFRWLLVWFKREFSQHDIMRLWEVLWTDLPCQNFHLLISVAILDTEKDIIIGRDYGFTEILKHINELSQKIELQWTLAKAEGIYHQIITAPHLNNTIRNILGMELVPEEPASASAALQTEESAVSEATPVVEPNVVQDELENGFERSLQFSYI